MFRSYSKNILMYRIKDFIIPYFYRNVSGFLYHSWPTGAMSQSRNQLCEVRPDAQPPLHSRTRLRDSRVGHARQKQGQWKIFRYDLGHLCVEDIKKLQV